MLVKYHSKRGDLITLHQPDKNTLERIHELLQEVSGRYLPAREVADRMLVDLAELCTLVGFELPGNEVEEAELEVESEETQEEEFEESSEEELESPESFEEDSEEVDAEYDED